MRRPGFRPAGAGPAVRDPFAPSPLRRIAVTAFMVVFLAYFMVPLAWILISSTKTTPDLFSTFGLWFGSSFELFGNISHAFSAEDGVFGRWMFNSFLYATVAALGAGLFSAMAGYAFAMYPFRGSKLLYVLILGSIMVPPTVFAIPIFLMMSEVGLVNSPLAFILPSMVSPVGVFLIRIYAQQAVPRELIDAARMDGASDLAIFWKVAMRLMLPATLTVTLLSFVETWNNYFLPLLLFTDERMYPLTVGLATWNGAAQKGLGLTYVTVITGALIAIVPAMIVFLAVQRWWQGGLTTGGVK
jgi:multiple sugar transport system permease protein